MSERDEERTGVSKYYRWTKPKAKPVQTQFVNSAQKKFYAIRMGFTVAKIAAIAVIVYLIAERIQV